MWDSQEYQLIDFGDGRKLEQFGAVCLDRVCPAAIGARKRNPPAWNQCDAALDEQGRVVRGKVPANWSTRFADVHFGLKLTPFGHVGVFPEQSENWTWIREWFSESRENDAPDELHALNLFAYTGGTSFAMAQAGAKVSHVDASGPAVRWARENASRSGLEGLPIRWLVEDAAKFVAREVRRGNRYDFIALDPPSYGHGPKGQRWSISDDLPQLLEQCSQLLKPNGRILLTAHCTRPSQTELCEVYRKATRKKPDTGRLRIQAQSGQSLDAGFYCR